MNFIIPLTLLINRTVLRTLAVCSCALRRIVKLPVVEGSFFLVSAVVFLGCYTTLAWVPILVGCLLSCGCL